MTSQFSALDYTNELESAGVPSAQAKAHANALTKVLGEVAFSRDLVTLESNLRKLICDCETRINLRIDVMRTELDARITKLEANMNAEFVTIRAEFAELRADFATLRAEFATLRAEFSTLRAEIASVRHELVLHRWVLGMVGAISMANLAITIRLVMP
jgi:chromosome segregation ATPase